MTKKVIIIASAVIAMLFAGVLIGVSILSPLAKMPHWFGELPIVASIILIVISLLIILISSAVLFHIKITKALRISIIIPSILIVLGDILLAFLMTYNFIDDYDKLRTSSIFFTLIIPVNIIFYIGSAAVITTLLTCIRRALKPGEIKENN